MIPYPAYKSTDLPWLPKIPEHWEIRKLRHLLSLVSTKNRPDLPLLSVVREKGVILRDVSNKEENHNYIPDDLSNYKLVKKGQFVMNKMKAWQGSYGVSDYDGIVSPAYFVFNLHGVMPSFFHRALRSKQYVPYFGQASDGIRVGQWDLSIPRMKEIPFAVPPLPKQEQIVRYLDSMTAKINKLIRAKKKQIALLQEQRQAIINQAVTKGLDPNVEMKDSGIDWIGKIPAHWESIQLRKVLRFVSIKNKVHEQLLSVTREQGVIVRNVESKKENHNYIPNDLSDYKYVEKNWFVINKMKAWQGSYAVSSYQGIVSPAYFVCRLDFTNKQFFSRAIRSKAYVPFFTKYSKGIRVGQWDLSATALRSIPFFVPPESEQRAIVAFLDKKVERINTLIAKYQEQIEGMLSFKQSVISSVVTGQTDVRNIIVDHVEQNEHTTEFDNMSNDLDNPIQESEEINDYRN